MSTRDQDYSSGLAQVSTWTKCKEKLTAQARLLAEREAEIERLTNEHFTYTLAKTAEVLELKSQLAAQAQGQLNVLRAQHDAMTTMNENLADQLADARLSIRPADVEIAELRDELAGLKAKFKGATIVEWDSSVAMLAAVDPQDFIDKLGMPNHNDRFRILRDDSPAEGSLDAGGGA